MAGIHNYTWAQGEDLTLSMIYKAGTTGAETPVDLTGYSVRMDMAAPDGTRVYTFNSADIIDLDGSGPGTDGDTDHEVVTPLTNDGVITIAVPRSLALPGGLIYDTYLKQTPPVLIYDYDLFVRDASANGGKQKKILKGQISIEKSVTMWE